MPTAKKIIAAGLIIFSAAAGLVLYSLKIVPHQKMQRGNKIVMQIDDYIATRGEPPPSLDVLILTEEDKRTFYYIKDDGSYEIWFGDGLGESITYRSSQKTWEKHN